MSTKLRTFSLILPLVTVVCCLIAWQPQSPQQHNTPPKVAITKPSVKDTFSWNTLVSYSITVADTEDGTSAYDEIATNEVYLKIRYVPDSSHLKTYLASEAKNTEPRELTFMKSSDCFNCHAFKSKLIGPSFETMAKQHARNAGAVTLLAGKIINGSQSATGTERMPAHPDLTTGTATDMVRWILKNSTDPDVDYLRGLEGTFRTRMQPQKNPDKAVYVLTASYTDHGLPDMPQTRKQGSYTMVLRSR